jgi:hypothetical protein
MKTILGRILLCTLLMMTVANANANHTLATQDGYDRILSHLDVPDAVRAALRDGYNPGPANSIYLIKWLSYQIDLTKERRKHYPKTSEIPEYERTMFGGWINEDAPRNCFDTRAEVLLRDMVPGSHPTPYPDNRCRILAGRWHDPYTDNVYTRTDQVDIDHLVPLQHAYYYGAFKWTAAERCHYANYLGNDYHLLTVNFSENRKKGSDDPRNYMPPNQKITCTYMSLWMKVKLIWDLDVDPEEGNWIINNLRSHHCDLREQVMGKREFVEQLVQRNEIPNVCMKRMHQGH